MSTNPKLQTPKKLSEKTKLQNNPFISLEQLSNFPSYDSKSNKNKLISYSESNSKLNQVIEEKKNFTTKFAHKPINSVSNFFIKSSK